MSESESTRQAWNVIAPLSSATPGEGVTALSTTTTAAAVDLFDATLRPYKGYFDRYITLVAEGADVYFLFSNANTPAINNAVSSTTVVAGTTTAVPWVLKDGVPVSIRLDPAMHRFLHLKAATGTPVVRIYPSSQPSTGYAY